jgi:hypothetical protein
MARTQLLVALARRVQARGARQGQATEGGRCLELRERAATEIVVREPDPLVR